VVRVPARPGVTGAGRRPRWPLPAGVALGLLLSALGVAGGLGVPLPAFDRLERQVAAAYLLAGLVACLLARPLAARWQPPRLWPPLAATVALFGAAYAAVDRLDISYPRSAALYAALVVLPVVAWLVRGAARPWPGALALATLAAAVLVAGATPDGYAALYRNARAARSATLVTNLYDLRLTRYQRVVDLPRARGGGLAASVTGDDTRFLLVTGDGLVYTFGPGDGALDPRRLPYPVPLNAAEFRRDAPDGILHDRFRVADVLARDRGDTLELYASHHWWRAADRCFVTRVSVLAGPRAALLAGTAPAAWRTLFDAAPCLPVTERDRPKFAGHHIGGRLAWLPDGALLVALGEHQFDGFLATRSLPDDPAADYGKTLRIDPATGAATHYSRGHRNPQGLYVDPAGAIWLTEHGPQGGDELNRVERDADYGWPHVTYGVNYGSHAWPRSATQGQHAGYTPPVYAWVPSLGISSLTGIETARFPWWQGNLLVGSLAGDRLSRVVLRDGRAVVVEPIPVGSHVRDILEAPDGTLLVWTDEAAILALEPLADPAEPAAVFATRCGGCHRIGDGRAHGIGPDLRGIVGRPAGRAAGFAYSPALAGAAATWTRADLDRFLADPAQALPGTAMQVEGIADPAVRAAIIAHLDGA
jgi:cytochrome c2